MPAHLDGNMLGGALGEIFSVDITTAVGQCASCGASGAMAKTMVYADAPGLVARCPACGGVMLRLARGGDRGWLDLRGIACLQLTIPEP
jgi:Zn finger protein HypA/HybF involved in hydrogenase expression